LEAPNDIDPNNTKLMSRWKSNRKFRQSGMEAKLAQAVLGPNWEIRYNALLEGKCPLAWADAESWQQFLGELMAALKEYKLTGWIALRGSSSTFLSIHPEKGCDPDPKAIEEEFKRDPDLKNSLQTLHYFDCKVIQAGGEQAVRKNFDEYKQIELFSDIDFNIKSPELIRLLKKSGAKPSPADVGKCYNQDDTMNAVPSLWVLKATWGERLKRDISFVGITDVNDTYGYTKHPFTYPIQ